MATGIGIREPQGWWQAIASLPSAARETATAHPPRVLRFALTGGVCGGLQLGLLHLLLGAGLAAWPANALAFLISAQVNFLVSLLFTWGDRSGAGEWRGARSRWPAFMLSLSGAAALNFAVFTLATPVLPPLLAAAAGIAAGAGANFLLGDGFVFAHRAPGVDRFGVLAISLALPRPAFGRPAASEATADADAGERTPLWASACLLAIALAAAALYLWDVVRNGYANTYYAAAVLSMTQNLSNFFFGAFDPGGFITVDKPPFALWVQAISAKVFGFNSLSILAPQALAGVATLLVIYHLVRRTFGYGAGLVSALAFALTPVVVAVNRDNLPDSVLVLLLVLAAWGFLNALGSSRLRPLLATAVLVGLAFNTKMLQAFIPVPAAAAVYFLCAPGAWPKRLLNLTLAGALLLGVSASWMVAVDLTPAANRPFVGGSADNTVANLVLGYNGFGRVLGNDDSPGPGLGNAGPHFGGNAGWFRMFNDQVAGEVSWLLLFAPLGLAAALLTRLGTPRTDLRRANLLFWGGWLALHFLVFSLARGIFHPYYTVAMAPAIAALTGPGLMALWGWYRRGGLPSIMLPAAVAATFGWALVVVAGTRWGQPWFTWALVVAFGLAIAGMVAAYPFRLSAPRLAAVPVLAPALAVLFIGPAVWSSTTVQSNFMGVNPTAGPSGGFAFVGVRPAPFVTTGGGPRGGFNPAQVPPGGGLGRQPNPGAQNPSAVPAPNARFGQPQPGTGADGQNGLGVGRQPSPGAASGAGNQANGGIRPRGAPAPAPNTPPAGAPAANGPAANGPAANSPAANDPAANSPAANGPAANSPAANGPAANGPANNGGQSGGAFAGRRPGGAFANGGPAAGPIFARSQADSALIAYLTQQQGDTKFLLATTDATSAEPFILATGKPVMAMGGFNSWDPAPTVDQLRAYIASGQLRYVLLGGTGGFGLRGQGERADWVAANCAPVPPAQYGSAAQSRQLYDCAGIG